MPLISILFLLFLAVLILIILAKAPVSAAKAGTQIHKLVEKLIKRKQPPSALLYINRRDANFSLSYSRNDSGIETSGVDEVKQQPFHIASVGKLFTSTVIFSLIEQKKCSLDTKIFTILPAPWLKDLFVCNNTDFSEMVTIEHLLSHTSGVADYFSDPQHDEDSLQATLLKNPDNAYTPLDLLDISRLNQSAHFRPGQGFHYSDTGYILLGLIIEKLAGKEFHVILDEWIFTPLGMEHSYLATRGPHPDNTQLPAPILVGGLDLRNTPALSADWSGGGIISTAGDLELFVRALFSGSLISKASLNQMMQEKNTFVRGIKYGTGMMKIKFGDFFPLLRFMNHMYGHMGILGTQLFFDHRDDTVYISNFSSDKFAEHSVRLLIPAVSLISRIRKDKRE
ncbi:serine hydrolase domain-containing protein [Salinispira pacifica]|uniref:Putative beta-lactamase class C n=1 Tax=Salinispira pacifica TaxID=1307761 RepID=V5WHW6_9SPIO|nr:hydrolase [Salinispira pacifica]AHC15393.1 Putative beta-lactamase class C [Salinispira pacifica]